MQLCLQRLVARRGSLASRAGGVGTVIYATASVPHGRLPADRVRFLEINAFKGSLCLGVPVKSERQEGGVASASGGLITVRQGRNAQRWGTSVPCQVHGAMECTSSHCSAGVLFLFLSAGLRAVPRSSARWMVEVTVPAIPKG